jgi:hypothetical protein
MRDFEEKEDELKKFEQKVVSFPETVKLELGPFEKDDIRDYVLACGGATSTEEGIVDELIKQTEGCETFVEQFSLIFSRHSLPH